MTDTPSTREKLRAIREVAAYRPLLGAGIIGLSMFVGALEGVGLGFILPIVTLVQDGAAPDSAGAMGIFVDAYGAVGLPFTLEFVVLGVGIVIGVRYAVSFLVQWLTALLKAGYERELRIRGFEHALDAETAYFDERNADEMLNAIITQTSHASGTILRFVRVVQTVLICTAYVAVALYFAPVLMLLTGTVFVGLMYASRYAFESGYDVGDRIADTNERLQGAVQAAVLGIREVKVFGLDDEFAGDFRSAVDRHARETVKRQRDVAAIGSVNQFMAAATIFALIYVGTSVASLSLASLGVFLFAMFRLAPLLSSLNGLLYQVDNELPHLVRTQSFIGRLAAHREDWGDDPVPTPVDRVAFESVDFEYPTGDDEVLDDVSFSVERGEFVAFVGPSGAGKSTIGSLLAGLYRPSDGRVLVDGTPIYRFDAGSWRSRIALVRQNPHLFNESLRYNLTIGARDASEDEIRAACEVAQVTEFLEDLPDGLDTVLGDDGVRLSGGQRQRVAIARAVLKDADVLVLDEATSDLDSPLEARVHDGIERLDRDLAVVAIAHRLSTVTDADRIHVVEDGAIVESGTHEDLLADQGEYATLYSAQSGGTDGVVVSATE